MSLFDPLNLFSGRTSQTGQSGFGLNSPLQSLRASFPSFLSSLPQNLLPNIFPGSNAGNANPAAGGQGATGSPSPAGGGQSFTTPGGLNVPMPPSPFVSPNAGPAVSNAPQTGGGLLGSAGSVLNSVTDTVRSLLNPGGPSAAPPPSAATGSNSIGNLPLSPGGLPAGLANTSATVVNTVANTLTGAQQAAQQTGSQITTQTTATPQPPGPMQGGPAQTAAVPAQQPTSLPQPLAQASQPQSSQPQAQTANTQAQPSNPMPASQQTAPARADASFAPAGNPATDRAAGSQQAQAPVQTAIPTAPQAAAVLAAVPLATTVAQAPVAQQLAGNPQAQPSGTPVAGTAALDAGGPVRAELTGVGTYTLDGPGLRRRGRMKVGAQDLGQWMLAAAQGRLHLMRPYDDDTPRQVAKVFQQMFWVLAIVAYGCLGLVLVSFLLSLGELPAAPTLRRWTGEFAWAGLLAALGAWWLGRQLMRAQRPPPDPIRR